MAGSATATSAATAGTAAPTLDFGPLDFGLFAGAGAGAGFPTSPNFRSTAPLQVSGDPAAEELSLGPTLFGDIASQIREAATTAW